MASGMTDPPATGPFVGQRVVAGGTVGADARFRWVPELTVENGRSPEGHPGDR